MHFLTNLAAFALSCSLASAGQPLARDEWQPSAGSLACLYLTTEPQWQGEGQNLCEVSGQCSKFSSRTAE